MLKIVAVIYIAPTTLQCHGIDQTMYQNAYDLWMEKQVVNKDYKYTYFVLIWPVDTETIQSITEVLYLCLLHCIVVLRPR